MSKIKIAELFYSIQGEGRYMGVPSVFLRTFGCNFKCAGFGMPRGELSTEIEPIAERIVEFKNYEELPLVSTGCDSYASWDPRFKDLSPMLTTDAIADRIMEILPFNEWKDEHLVITGGEPLLGWQRAYPDLLSHPKMTGLKEITFETNGTQKLDPKFKEYLTDWLFGSDEREITFSVSAKLPCSGEKWEEAIKPEVVKSYLKIPQTDLYFKFVVATEADVNDVDKAVEEYLDHGVIAPTYLMPVGGMPELYHMNTKEIALLAMKKGYRYSPRLQVDIFRNEWGT